jgi:DNA-binding CsgD family transcriptional regulator/tetratricopeptide (TPR) repeat protein
MSMQLLERECGLSSLAAALAAANARQGCIALVSGEAGIGKTSFVEHFLAAHARAALVLKGNCDALSMPLPLAPLHDIARQFGGDRLRIQLESGSGQTTLFSTFLDLLQSSSKPVVLVIEDIHWADESTLDLVRYLSRRIAFLPVLVIATHRDDEIGHLRPLQRLLGNLANSKAVHRIELARLSVDAVRKLAAGRVADIEALHRQTAGNPFFISEIVAASGRGIPVTVRDAVLARAAQLEARGRDMLEMLAVIGTRIEHRMLEQVVAHTADGLADCMSVGMLQLESDCVAFRHELVREAMLEAIDPLRRRKLYRIALQIAVKLRGADRSNLARIAHFAEGADDTAGVIKYGTMAAEAAASLGAHRQAAAQYLRVLRFADGCTPAERAAFLRKYADECATIDNLDEAIKAYQEAIELCLEMRDRRKEGETLAALAWPLVRSGQNAAAEEASDRAIAVLRTLPPARQLAAAYRIKAHLRMLDRDRGAAVKWGNKAIELAKQLQDHTVVAEGEMVVGSAILVTGDDRGRQHLDRCLQLASENGLDPLVALAYLNLGSSYGEQYRFADADRELTAGIAFARSRDLDLACHYMCAWLALTRLYQGRWTEAAELASAVIAEPHLAAVSKIMALVALGRVRARRGDPGAAQALDEALELASSTGTLQRLAPVRAARAELAWFAADRERVATEACSAYDLALRYRHRWHVGEFAYWRRLAHDRVLVPKWAARPFTLQVEGNWKRAAAEWRHLGCPYEEARALAEGDLAAQFRALEIFDAIEAAPAATQLRQCMRAAGVKRIPRGRRASTRKNPFGLTSRELETLRAITRRLSNRGIAVELGISAKTVDHHVSAVLAKLGATSRAEAAKIAHEQRLVAQDGEGTGPK